MTIEVDGRTVEIGDRGARRLSEFLRDSGGAASVKVGCEEGACGACTVEMDGRALPSCLVPVARARGAVVRTAATLASTPRGVQVLDALSTHGAVQCGFCTPGILVEAVTSLGDPGAHDGSRAEAVLEGHLCRCTGYIPILGALRHVFDGGANDDDDEEEEEDGALHLPGDDIRVDVRAKANGSACFAADAVPEPHLYATVIGSPVAHARVRVDGAPAKAVPGVRAVLGPSEDPGTWWSPAPHGEIHDTRVFTSEPRFAGDIIAAVAASSREALERGVAAVRVEVTQDLPHVVDLDAALRPDGGRSWSEATGNVIEQFEAGTSAEAVQEAMAQATSVSESTYTIDRAPHGYLERPAAAAQWTSDGGPTCRVWSSTQHPFLAAAMLTRILALPSGSVSFEPVYVGGGFGGKEELWLEPAAALLSRSCGGAAVLLEVDREFATRSRVRHGGRISVRCGLDRDRISAWEVTIDLDAGADSGHSPAVARSAAGRALRAVPIPAARSVGRAIRTNTTPATAFRGYGGTEALFAVESELDEVARRAGVDPVEFRVAHGLRAGDLDPLTGATLLTYELERCLRRSVDLAGPPPAEGRSRWRRGRGVAAVCDSSGMTRPGSVDEAVARCVLRRGRIVVETGVAEIGQGNHTAFARIAAEALGVDAGRVAVRPVRSIDAPPDGGVYASRGVHVTGTAVHRAAVKLREAISWSAVDRLDRPYDSIRLRPDTVLETSDRMAGLDELPDLSAEGHFAAPDSALVAGAQVADVAVDTETGAVLVERVVSVHDIGRVIHPTLARGQVHGAVVQGIGLALMDPARTAHPRGFLDHLIPTATDVPDIVVEFVEVPHPTTPLGAKGIGEAPIIGIAPAIANAVADATGGRVRQLPMNPERVLAAIRRAQRDLRGTVFA